MINVAQRNGVGDADATFILLLEYNVRRLFVDTDAKPFEFVLDHLLVSQRLVHIQHDKNEVACLSDRYDLTTAAFTILCSLNDTWQIEHLDCCTIVLNLAWYGSQGRKLVSGGCSISAGS